MAKSEAQKAARREYMREYRKRNKERLNQQAREWRHNNPDKVREYNVRFWMKRAGEVDAAAATGI